MPLTGARAAEALAGYRDSVPAPRPQTQSNPRLSRILRIRETAKSATQEQAVLPPLCNKHYSHIQAKAAPSHFDAAFLCGYVRIFSGCRGCFPESLIPEKAREGDGPAGRSRGFTPVPHQGLRGPGPRKGHSPLNPFGALPVLYFFRKRITFQEAAGSTMQSSSITTGTCTGLTSSGFSSVFSAFMSS